MRVKLLLRDLFAVILAVVPIGWFEPIGTTARIPTSASN